MSVSPNALPQPLFGHPPGLFSLFFVEMWERFSYYGMRALLTFYMIKGFLGYGDSQAYGVYAAYGALVYATPFIGGMLADKLLGARRAVILGGLLMAAGHLALAIESSLFFYLGLALLIAGNGLFKPNISTIVGGLYPGKDIEKRDSGFTIFYMGINLGAAMSPLLCGYIGETYGWHYGFGIATIGMLVGLATFVVPHVVARFLILFSAAGTAALLFIVAQGGFYLMVNAAVGTALLAAGVIAFMALGRGSLPRTLGAVPFPDVLRRNNLYVYGGIVAAVAVFTLLLQAELVAKIILYVLGAVAFGSLIYEAFRMQVIARHRLLVALILMFFSMLFWALFEQAGSSISNFTDRNVDRVFETRAVTEQDVGATLNLELT
ncbi:MAG TPA: oligopeptide:H+ symporter, partial [Myxococcota bacterium]|nr:oligopeptide:H+ symporter [Myxococcota bacterium]